MAVYRINDKKIIRLKEINFDLERNIQKLVELNIGEIFSLCFISTELPLNNLRIDTLAFDEAAKSFVIIEYKKDRNLSVIDQGYAYLALLLNNKADFILELNEKCHKSYKKSDIDWSQSRVIFVSPAFTRYQKEAMGFKDLPIELWEVKLFEDNLLIINQINVPEKNESINVVAKGKEAETVAREVKVYSLEDLLKTSWSRTNEIYESLSQRIIEIDAKFESHPTKLYIAFTIDNKNVVQVTPKSDRLLLDLLRVRPEDLSDPEDRVRYQENSYKWYSQHISQFDIRNEDDVDYAISLIKQVYKKHFI